MSGSRNSLWSNASIPGIALGVVASLSCSDAGKASRTLEPPTPTVTTKWSLAKAPGNNGDLQADTIQTLITPLQVVVRANDTVAAGVKVIWQVFKDSVDVGTLASLTDAAGVAMLQFTLGPQTGAFVIVAALDSGSNAEPVTFNVAATAGHPAAVIAVSGTDQTDTATAPLKNEYVARVIDRLGNGVSNVAVHWQVTAGGGSIAATSGDTTAPDGQARARLTLGRSAGLNTATASAAGIDASLSFSSVATAAHPTQLAIVSGNNQTGQTGQVLNADDVVKLTDSYGNAVAGASIVWAITAGGGSLSANQSLTSADGSAATRSTLGGAAGTQTVVATASPWPNVLTVSFSATATPAAPGPPSPSLASFLAGFSGSRLSLPRNLSDPFHGVLPLFRANLDRHDVR